MPLIPKADKDTTEKEFYNLICLIQKSLIKYQQTEFINTSKGSYTMIKCDYPCYANMFQAMNMIYYINIMEDKHHTIVLIDAGK